MTLGRPINGPLAPTLAATVGGSGLPWESSGGGAPLVAPTITISGTRGGTLTAVVTGAPTVQWQAAATPGGGGSYANVPGATALTLDDTEHSPSDVRCVATNAAGSATSNVLDGFDVTDLASCVGCWEPIEGDASDNGTTLTCPNRVAGGAAADSTGAGRPTINATAINGKPGIDCSAISGTTWGPGTIAAVTGATGMTWLFLALRKDASPGAASRLWAHGGGNQGANALYNSPHIGGFRFARTTGGGTVTTDSESMDLGFTYPRVVGFRAEMTDLDSNDGAVLDDETTTHSSSGTGSSGAMAAAAFVIGTSNAGSGAFEGYVGAAAVFNARLTDAQIALAIRYFMALAEKPRVRKALFCGDSITACSVALSAQWRSAVQDLYEADHAAGDRWLEMVGPVSNANVAFTEDFSAAGGGQTTAGLETFLATHDMADRYTPDLIMVMIGTNDIGAGTALATIATAYVSLLAALHAAFPDVPILVEELTERGDGFADEVVDYNANHLPGVVADAVTAGVNCVLDSTIADSGIVLMGDNLHLDASCEAAVAAAVYAKLKTEMGIA